jgi:hypothetical protein
MTVSTRSWLPLLLLAITLPLPAAPVTLASTTGRTALLELYTSEGCSSCPPADRWLSALRDDPRLWREFVPVAFHVDYWDYIGWRDRFAKAAHSLRQRAYAAAGRVGTVYTPGFVVAGREWRGWFRGQEPELDAGAAAGELALELDGGRVAARYAAADAGPLDLHLALLGFGLESEVGAGENAGQRLRHDFVVLDHRRQPLAAGDGQHRAQFDWDRRAAGAERYAVAAWVTPRGGLEPLQALGGWLPAGAR